MWSYIKFELKNTIGYSIAMIVGGLLPLILVMGNYKSTSNIVANQALAKGLFATMLPMIPLGLVVLPFTIAFGRDVSNGVTTRLTLFGYSMTKQLVAKFMSVLILVLAVTTVYCVVLTHMLPLPPLSALSMANIFISIVLLSTSLYLLSFVIAQVFQGFNLIQGVAMICYFGIAFLTGSMGTFQLPHAVENIMQWIPFKAFRDTLKNNWDTTSITVMQDEAIKMMLFLSVTVILFFLATYYRRAKKMA